MDEIMIQDMENLKNVVASVKAYRLAVDLDYLNQEIDKKAPKMIGSNEGFFSSLGKQITNSLNNSSYNSLFEKKNKTINELESLKKNYTIYEGDDLKLKLNDLFKNDITGISKLEFCMNIILDNSFEYEVRDFTFSKISMMLNENPSYLLDLRKELIDSYKQIAITGNNAKTLKNAVLIGSILTIAIVTGGVGGLIGGYAASASVTTAGLASLGFGMAEGVAILALGSAATLGLTVGVSYAALTAKNKLKVKKNFQSLTVDEATMSLVKTCIAMIHLKKNRENEACKELYNSYVEQYLDLKSDVDLNLFMNDFEVELNKDKNKLFNNADELLKKKLFA